VLLSDLPVLAIMPLIALPLRYVDIRVPVGIGPAVLAPTTSMQTGFNPQSTGGDFVWSQLLHGFGTILSMAYINQAAIRSVPREVASDAVGLYNAARNLGGSFALAGIAVIQDQRTWLHALRIEEPLSANSNRVQDYIAEQAQILGGTNAAYRVLGDTIQTRPLTMTSIELFHLLFIGVL
jgi:DHA2 family multidrug resistance protein